jgi:hypothetical protein
MRLTGDDCRYAVTLFLPDESNGSGAEMLIPDVGCACRPEPMRKLSSRLTNAEAFLPFHLRVAVLSPFDEV